MEVSKWVASLVVSQNLAIKRAKLIKQLMQVVIELQRLSNFNSLMGIVNGLNTPSITRLQTTWLQTKKKYVKLVSDYEEIVENMSPNNHFQKYRILLKNSIPPCIPYLTVYLNDMMQIEGELKSYNTIDNRNYINFEKIEKISLIMSDIQLYKQQIHNFQKINQIYDFFDRGLFYMEEEQVTSKAKELEITEAKEPIASPNLLKKFSRKGSGGVFGKISLKSIGEMITKNKNNV